MSKVKLLLYCTKSKPYLRDYRGKAIFNRFVISPENKPFTSDDKQPILNGKIVANCDCEKVEEFTTSYRGDMLQTKTIGKDSCLSLCDLIDYQRDNNCLYAIHLSNLYIFDKPVTFERDYIYKDTYSCSLITKAPQNMCRVYDRLGNKYILISIRPEWVCKILNGEKTIEVRKQIIKDLKEMKENDN